ncbi:Late secretory pathway protein AVL9 [Wickerhamiella sorbophila]|uniref:Late secretory pathway protein AVL9 n=1 Tax=Wickerhamiella sorbophila TaxID=45607 RepID=A0A2T0FBY4_9ASCO|nr:Late secretory pathway protein AVL9 [Wickerhamiella sorbophila]PRT52477.1 Late secretory pathway protein AVL9 [Wickerhamiella sorbophila]
MGPKRKNNKNSRGGRGSVASRVAQFEAAAAGSNTKSSKSSKSNKTSDTSDEAGITAQKNSSPGVSVDSSDRDSTVDPANDPLASSTHQNSDPKPAEDGILSKEDTQKENNSRDENDACEYTTSGDILEESKQARSTQPEGEPEHEAAAAGENHEQKLEEEQPSSLEPTAEQNARELHRSETSDNPEVPAEPEPEPVAEMSPKFESSSLESPTQKSPKSISKSTTAQHDAVVEDEPTPDIINSGVESLQPDTNASIEIVGSESENGPSSLEADTPQLAPSPLPQHEEGFLLQDNDDDDDGVEIIETQNVTYVGGSRPVFVKPVLVAPTEDDFKANIDPNTYFADPEDTVIEEATSSPCPSHPTQRVRMVGRAASVVSPSIASSVQVVQVGQKGSPSSQGVIKQNMVKHKEVQVPVATSLSEDAEILGVAVVGFHHTRGPEIEYWVGPDGDQSDLWPYLPFQSLPDGSHSFEESICYFTLLYDRRQHRGPNPTPERDEEGHIIDSSDFNDVTTLFAVSCSRQVATADLEHAPKDATRSSVHKSIVVVARKPVFSLIKEKLTVVTRSYFEQGQFDDRTIIDRFYENLVHLYSLPQSDSDFQVGINVRDFFYRFGVNVMVIFKALLMEKRILFYGSDTDLLCTFQFALISLIPNLLNHLEDCGSPLLSNYETNLVKPTYMQSSNRDSMLKFMGLPLHVFAAGGIFNPFVPLQQLDELTRKETQYGLFGSTNQLFLTAANADVIVNIDQNSVDIVNTELTSALALSSADKAFIQPIASAVVKSWDGDNKWQPRSLGYLGSDDYIRQQFEDYLLGLLASVKYEAYLQRLGPEPPKIFTRDFAPNPLKAFNLAWASQWKLTNNYRIFNKFTDDELFDIIEPAHVATIKNRARIDAISDPSQYSAPKEDKVKGFFSGLFKRSAPSEKTTSEMATSEKTVDDSMPEPSAASPDLPSTPTKTSDSEQDGKEVTPPAEEAPPSPHKLMFWR